MMQVTKLFPEYLLCEKKAEFGGVQRGRNCLIKCKDEVKKPVQGKNLKFKGRIGNYSSS